MFDVIELETKKYISRVNQIKEYINFHKTREELILTDCSNPEILKYIELGKKVNKNLIYNTIVISLYGAYENFIDNVLIAYLDSFQLNGIKYENIPEKIKESNILFSGKKLFDNKKIDIAEKEDIIINLYSCIMDEREYQLNNKEIISHPFNLSTAILSDLFKQIGINNILQIIKQDDKLIKYYMINKSIDYTTAKRIIQSTDNIFNNIDDIVQRRNIVAHSWEEQDILSLSILNEEYIELFKIFGQIIENALKSNLFETMKNCNMTKVKDNIIQVYNNKIVCLNCGDDILKKNQYVLIEKNNLFYIGKIINIQNNKINIERSEQNMDIGMEILTNTLLKKEIKIYFI